VTGDVTRVFQYDPETNDRVSNGEFQRLRGRKIMLIFSNVKEIIHYEFVPPKDSQSAVPLSSFGTVS
jgi:hypothetical protein